MTQPSPRRGIWSAGEWGRTMFSTVRRARTCPPGQLPPVLVAAGEESRVRPAEPERHAEALGRAHADVGSRQFDSLLIRRLRKKQDPGARPGRTDRFLNQTTRGGRHDHTIGATPLSD